MKLYKGDDCATLGSRLFAACIRIFFPAMFLAIVSVPVEAAASSTTDTQLLNYLQGVCNTFNSGVYPSTWNAANVGAMCAQVFPFCRICAGRGTPPTSNSNLGIAGAGNSLSIRKKKRGQDDVQDESGSGQGASGDGSDWGVTITPQRGGGTRNQTDLENGYTSTLNGLLIGADRRFSDTFLFGVTLSRTDNYALFYNDAGSLKTTSDVINLYATWVPTQSISVDAYLGVGRSRLDNIRAVSATLISGNVSGTTNGVQQIAGVSAAYMTDLGGVSVSPFFNVDFIKTRIGGYSETGTTLLEMTYGAHDISSLTNSAGVRLGTSYGFDWGTLLPAVRVAGVHEFQAQGQAIYNELVSTPGTGMTVGTDAATRNYLVSGFDLVAEIGHGKQIFLDYDRHTHDSLINTWVVSLGAMFQF